jgi:hypothetical protein
MKEIAVNGVSRMVPQKLSELSQQELVWLISKIAAGADPISIKLQFAMRFWKLPVNRVNRIARRLNREKNLLQKLIYNENYLEINSRLFLLAEQFDFLISDRELTVNPFPTIKLPWYRFARKLHGPADGLKNISIWEFALAERALIDYFHTEEPEHLDNLMAILYRPASIRRLIRRWFVHTPDIRQGFNDQTFEERIPTIRRIPLEVKVGVSLFVNSVRESFKDTERFPHIYNNLQKRSTGKDLSWADVIMEMSGEVPGNEARTGEVNLYTFLYRLELNAIKAEEIKKQTEALKK